MSRKPHPADPPPIPALAAGEVVVLDPATNKWVHEDQVKPQHQQEEETDVDA